MYQEEFYNYYITQWFSGCSEMFNTYHKICFCSSKTLLVIHHHFAVADPGGVTKVNREFTHTHTTSPQYT